MFHGCDDLAAQSIAPVGGGHGVVLGSGSPAKDFGQGFYTTTNVHQAEQWANRRLHTARRRGAKRAAVLRFTIEREALAKLDHMAFVRGDVAPNSDYWQLVSHCRSGKDHGRVEKSYYDVVYGPVSLFPQLLVIADADQISFHTEEGLSVLGNVTVAPYGSPFY